MSNSTQAEQPALFVEYRIYIQHAARIANVPEGYIVGLIHTESRWNPHARSPAGAMGLGQFMPATAQELAKKHPLFLHPVNFSDVRWQLTAIGLYLQELDKLHEQHKMYAVRCNRLGSMASAYNGGFRWAKARWEKSGKKEDYWMTVRTINPGITASNQKENENYAVKLYLAQQKYPVARFCFEGR